MPRHGQLIGPGFEDPPFSPPDGQPAGGADAMGGVDLRDSNAKETPNDCGCDSVMLMNVTGSDLGIGDTIGIERNDRGVVAVAAGVRQPFMKISDI
jgi:hypothetical protein